MVWIVAIAVKFRSHLKAFVIVHTFLFYIDCFFTF